ncbi:ABC transporter ATP-binding protein [Solilutibacter silvestris]|uniref:ABC-type multidrug transport system ATPase component n=1 Tax=Solilutibacter silvestris TaxID=1645665 RepID=A0A2K1Q274_9GAMM|nr:ABC transporter ATP-binding protein [Lysobacter silvestris]PNS09133.1 ABC-type multidrug transport system ATPase component [Lysobacter silvestris]
MDMATQVIARLDGARKQYGTVQALAGLDLDIHRGEVLALLGANGAGKTTAISLLLGLAIPTQGNAELFGQLPHEIVARRRIGVMLQTASIPDNNTVQELLELTRSYYPQPRALDDCIRLAGLQELLKRRYGKLSGGQQRRVQFALAICGDPELIFLDEPTTGLDIESRETLWNAIRSLVAQGTAVLLTTHYLEEAQALADRVVVIHNGREVAQGTVDEIRAVVSEQRIRCRSLVSQEQLAAWPGVHEARVVDGRVELIVEDAASVLRWLLSLDPTLDELEVTRAGLADAFLALTRDSQETH